MPEEPIQQARKAIQAGKLPVRPPDRTWGGPGVDIECPVCGKPVTKADMEFEIQFAHDGTAPGLDNYHLHVRCFAAWEFERASLGGGR